jgi:hypothetical protein
MSEDRMPLNILVADLLREIQNLKYSLVRNNQYEQAAKIRAVEKQFEKIACDLLIFSYPLFPNKGLTVNGKIYSIELFRYAQATHWTNVPQNIVDLLKLRKQHFDGLTDFTNDRTQKLIGLNQILTREQKRIEGFLTFINKVISLKSIRGDFGNLSCGSITMECYTNGDCYESYGDGFGIKTAFYEFEIPVVDLSNDLERDGDSENKDQALAAVEFLNTLPDNFRDEKICYLFLLIANIGLLSWDDMLNIDHVAISSPFNYRFSQIEGIS